MFISVDPPGRILQSQRISSCSHKQAVGALAGPLPAAGGARHQRHGRRRRLAPLLCHHRAFCSPPLRLLLFPRLPVTAVQAPTPAAPPHQAHRTEVVHRNQLLRIFGARRHRQLADQDGPYDSLETKPCNPTTSATMGVTAQARRVCRGVLVGAAPCWCGVDCLPGPAAWRWRDLAASKGFGMGKGTETGKAE